MSLSNRPGLPAIAYRVGTYASFRQGLQVRLSDSRWPILRQLRTRADDDSLLIGPPKSVPRVLGIGSTEFDIVQ